MAFPNGLPIFDWTAYWRGGPSFNAFALNQTTDKLEVVFQAPAAIAITRLGFNYGARTGTPPTYKISLQGVDASGNPDGTIKGGGSPASTTFTPPASSAWNTTWRWHTLDNAFTCARGDMLAWVIEYSSGTVDGSNNSSFNFRFNSTVTQNFPYIIQNDAGVRSRANIQPFFGYGLAGTAYGLPAQTTGGGNVNSGSSPNEYGVNIVWPTWLTGATLMGVRLMLTATAATTLKAQLYSGGLVTDTTPIQDVTFDMDAVSTVSKGYVDVYFDEATLTTLVGGASYSVSIAPQSGTNISIDTFAAADALDWAPWPGGTDWTLATRAGGNWTFDATKRMGIGLIIDAPSSGGAINPFTGVIVT